MTDNVCPDCAAPAGEAHDAGCDVARCLVTGLQRLGCRAGHDCGEDRWSTQLTVTLPTAFDPAMFVVRFGRDTNDLPGLWLECRQPGVHLIGSSAQDLELYADHSLADLLRRATQHWERYHPEST